MCMNLSELVNRPRMYDSEDGVGELTIGLMSMLMGSACLAVPRPGYEAFVAMGIILCFGAGIGWVVKKLKERVTYPRGGYVALNVPPVTIRRRALAAVLTFAFVFGIEEFIHVFRPGFTFRVSGAGLSAMYFGFYTFGGMKYQEPRMLWLAAFSAVLGVWVYARNYSVAYGLPFVTLWQGVALAIAGGIRLWRFIKAHPRPVETEA